MTFMKTAGATALLAIALPAAAADISQLGLSQSQVDALNAQLTAPVVSPGIAFGSPVAFGVAWREAFVAVGGNTISHPSGNQDRLDGSAAVGVGLGNPVTFIGLEAVATAISFKDNFGEDGDLSLKLHRVLPGRAGIAVGVDNTSRWGAPKSTKAGTYLAFTKVFDVGDMAYSPTPISFNIGLGNGRFARPGHNNEVGVFGSMAVAPWRQVSFIADYDGRDGNAGVSIVPFARMPLVVTVGAINIGRRYGKDTEFAGGVGYLFSF
jgi:hypothetical protein